MKASCDAIALGRRCIAAAALVAYPADGWRVRVAATLLPDMAIEPPAWAAANIPPKSTEPIRELEKELAPMPASCQCAEAFRREGPPSGIGCRSPLAPAAARACCCACCCARHEACCCACATVPAAVVTELDAIG